MRSRWIGCTGCLLALALGDGSPAQGSQRLYGYDARGNRISASNQIRFTSATAFTIQPRRAVAGDTLNVYGRNFPAGQNGSVSVTLGGAPAIILNVATRVITVEVPAGVTGGLVQVSIGGGPPLLAGSLDVEAVEVSPVNVSLDYDDNMQFSANVIGGATSVVTWMVNGVPGGDPSVGTISAAGLYTAPSIASAADFPFLITASSAELGIGGHAVVNLTCANPTPSGNRVFGAATLGSPFERHCHVFTGQALDRAFVAFRGTRDILSLKLRGPNGVVLASAGPGAELRIPEVLLPLSGEYHIEVQGQAPPGDAYALWLDHHPPLPAGTWLYPADGSWGEPRNWSYATLPGSTDDVVIADFPDDITITVEQGVRSVATIFSEERLTLTGGTLAVSGTVTVNNDLTLDGGTLSDATVLAGTGSMSATANPSNRLDGVTVNGDLELSAASAVVRIAGGISLGTAHLSGADSSLAFEGSQTVHTGTISFESTGGPAFLEMQSAGTLTLAPGVTVHGQNGVIGGNNLFSAGMDLVNQGTISADSAGQTLLVAAPTWSSPGTLTAPAGTLQLDGTLDTQSVGAIDGTGGTVEILGTLANTGSTLVLDAGPGSVTLSGGQILGGTVTMTGGAMLGVSADLSNRLMGVTINGDLDLAAAGAVVRIAGDLTLNGTAHLGGSGSSLAFEGSQALQAGTISFEAPVGLGYIEMQSAGTLTLSPGVTVHGGNGVIGGNNHFAAAMDLVNQATLSPDVSGQSLSVQASSFVSTGTVALGDGALDVVGMSLQAGSLTGSGTINGPVIVQGATVQPGGTEAGTIVVNGDYTQSAGSLLIDLGGTVPGTEHDQLIVSGSASLADTLSVSLINAFSPLLAQTYDLVTHGSRTGVFATTDLPALGGGLVLQVVYLEDSVQLVVQ